MQAGKTHESRKPLEDGAPSNGDGRSSWTTTTPLEGRFAQAEEKLNSSRRDLIRQILEEAEETCFLSSRDLAKRYQVDAATIVRSIQALGYEKYGDFIADLRAHFVTHISPYTLMKVAAREHRSLAGHVEHSMEMELQNLHAMRSQLRTAEIIDLAKLIDRSRRILVVGVDFAASLSHLLSYALVSLGYDSEAPNGSTGSLQQKVNLLGKKDLLIGISFGRCLRATVDAVVRAHEHGVRTVGITDNPKTAIARFCDSFLLASVASPSFHGSYVAPVATINAILVACAHLHPEHSLAVLQHKELEFRSGTRWYSPENKDKKNKPDNHNLQGGHS